MTSTLDSANAIASFCDVKSKSKALHQFCEAFNMACEDLSAPENLMKEGPELSKWMEKHSLSLSTVHALISCEFDDPHFIGGPCAFEYMQTNEDVEKNFKEAEVIFSEIYAALLKVSKKKADFFIGVVHGLRAWMIKKTAQKIKKIKK